MQPVTHLLLLATAWLLYGILHSLLASRRCKVWFRARYPHGYRGYRLAFNLLSLLLLAPPLWLLSTYSGETLWHWPTTMRWLFDAAALAAIAGFVSTISAYDSGEFFGISQLRSDVPEVDDQAPMSLSWAHRYVRHPWYFFGLVIIWTREMNAALLLSAVVLTLYLLIGSRMEERKLLSIYGERYRRYMREAPGLVPRPWRFLSRKQAEQLRANR